MSRSPHHKQRARTALWTGLAAVAVLISACSTGTPIAQGAGADATPVAGTIPPIDAAQPARVETATFAMG